MHILMVADGRSPIAARWAEGLIKMGMRVSLVSTFPCQPLPGVKLVDVLPVGFSGLAGSQIESRKGQTEKLKGKARLAILRPTLQKLRYFIAPMTLPYYGRKFKALVAQVKPDIVHALRIPYEGMLASYLPEDFQLIVATWGNDLTLHAYGSFLMRSFTRRALRRANGLTSDTERDVRLAHEWGLTRGAPTLVVPGNGGVDLQAIKKLSAKAVEPSDSAPLIINPRGFRPGSVHQEIFFQAIPHVLEKLPNARFLCTGMQNQSQAVQWVNRLGIQKSITLLPYLNQTELWQILCKSHVYVSISSHDGTPNSLLEAMACGCLPVCGNIESIREWITDGENGLLVDPHDPAAVAQCILRACQDDELRTRAKKINMEIIQSRAAVNVTWGQIEKFYKQFIPKQRKERGND